MLKQVVVLLLLAVCIVLAYPGANSSSSGKKCPFVKHKEEKQKLDARVLTTLEKINTEFKGDSITEDKGALYTMMKLVKDLAVGNAKAVQFLKNMTVVSEGTVNARLEKPTLVAIVVGEKLPARRQDDQEFISVGFKDEESTFFEALLPSMNKVGKVVEKMHGKRLFPITIDRLHVTNSSSSLIAIFDVPNAKLLVHDSFFYHLSTLPFPVQTIEESYEKFIAELESMAQLSKENLIALLYKLPNLFHESLAFCIACSVILAVGLPFVFNYIFIAIANFICTRYHYSEDDCQTLELMAMALAYAMIIPGAFIVLKVCKLTTCQQVARGILYSKNVMTGMLGGGALMFVKQTLGL